MAQVDTPTGESSNSLESISLSDSFTDKAWDGSLSRFTDEEAFNAVPKAVAAHVRKQAKEAGKDPAKSDLKLPYKEPDGTINIAAVRNALARLSQTDLPADVKDSAKSELESKLDAYKKKQGIKAAEPTVIADQPILTTGQTKLRDEEGNLVEITPKMLDEVVQSYKSGKVHLAPVVIGPHEDTNLSPVAHIKDVYKSKVPGDSRPWLFGKIEAAEGVDPKEVKAAIDRMKFNSPEIEPEVYKPESTRDWPDGVDGQWYLRRVNIVPLPAQFGMPQARMSFADEKGKFIAIKLSSLERKNMPIMKCPQCGKEFADGSQYCNMDGSKLIEKGVHMSEAKETPEAKAGTGTTAKAEDITALTEQNKALVDQVKALADANKALEGRLQTQEVQLAEEKKIRRKQDIEAAFEELGTRFVPAMREKGAVLLAEKLDELERSHSGVIALADGAKLDLKIKLAESQKDGTTKIVEKGLLDTLLEVLANTPHALAEASRQIRVVSRTAVGNDSIVSEYENKVRKEQPQVKEHVVYRTAVSLAEKDPRWVKEA